MITVVAQYEVVIFWNHHRPEGSVGVSHLLIIVTVLVIIELPIDEDLSVLDLDLVPRGPNDAFYEILAPVFWIAEDNNVVSHRFLGKVTVAGISNEGNNFEGAEFYQPYQAYIAQGDYPFIRKVFCINRQTYSGLGYGLSAFIAGEKGQLILLHSGLVPATMPVRIVEIRQ